MWAQADQPSSPDSGASTPSAPKKRLQRVEILKIVDSDPMIEPSMVRVAEPRVMVADPVVTPFELLRQKAGLTIVLSFKVQLKSFRYLQGRDKECKNYGLNRLMSLYIVNTKKSKGLEQFH